jgi:hypothetical protein
MRGWGQTGRTSMKQNLANSINHQYVLPFNEVKTEETQTKFKQTAIEGEKMTGDEKYIYRYIFQNKIYKADGQKFEDLFTDIMKYAEPEFQQIKPHGSTGDKKNDGYIKSKGIYFQVYGPEDIAKSVLYAKGKLKKDFTGLLQAWKSVKEFYFIVNDKYKGIPYELETEMNKLLEKNNLKGGVKGAACLENRLFSLADDQILAITGLIPDPSKIRLLDYSILNEVISYIMEMSLANAISSDILLSDWNKKIKFNKLSSCVADLLNSGSIQINGLDKYLMNQGNFFADELRNKMNEIYIAEKEHFIGDKLFWRIVSIASPRAELAYQTAVIVIMAKYFEACDIFERPTED